MAFNWKIFKTRALTAVVFAVVMLTGLLWNQWSFLVLFSIIHFGCWWEYFNLLEKIHNTSYHRHTRLGFMLMGYAIVLWFCGTSFEVNNYRLKENFSFPVAVAGVIMLAIGIFQTRQINLKAFGTAALGLLYISLSWGLMCNFYKEVNIHLHDTKFVFVGNSVPIIIIASIWINDTMAYIVGSLIGRRPLSKVSPKKTWEGTIGGVILSAVLMFFLWNRLIFSFSDFTLNIIVGAIALLASVFGTFGDLLESKLKRMAGVKDSGNFMPGHGGFLDRFDSLLLATPAVWLFVYFMM